MGRLLAIDYGKKRVGLAVTDPLQITANGLDTVASHEVLDYLTRYLEKETVDMFLLGSPKQNDNTDSENMARVKEFAKALKRRFPDKEIVMPGDTVTFKVKLLAPIAMNNNDRFAIREGGRTVGSGVVTKIEK